MNRPLQAFAGPGAFELARLALIEAKELRRAGDSSEKPTESTAEECEELAEKLDLIAAKYQLSVKVARAMAQMIREEQS